MILWLFCFSCFSFQLWIGKTVIYCLIQWCLICNSSKSICQAYILLHCSIHVCCNYIFVLVFRDCSSDFQVSSDVSPALRMVKVCDDLYYIYSQPLLSPLQSFSVAVALVHSQSPTLWPISGQDMWLTKGRSLKLLIGS